MIPEIKRIATALQLSDGGLLKIARDIAHDGSLLSVGHMRKGDQQELLKFLRIIGEKQYTDRERHDRVLV